MRDGPKKNDPIATNESFFARFGEEGNGVPAMTLHKEISFENEICAHLAANGWLYEDGSADRYDRARALFPADVLAWVQTAQPSAWEGLVKSHGSQAEAALLDRLCSQLEQRGTLWTGTYYQIERKPKDGLTIHRTSASSVRHRSDLRLHHLSQGIEPWTRGLSDCGRFGSTSPLPVPVTNHLYASDIKETLIRDLSA